MPRLNRGPANGVDPASAVRIESGPIASATLGGLSDLISLDVSGVFGPSLALSGAGFFDTGVSKVGKSMAESLTLCCFSASANFFSDSSVSRVISLTAVDRVSKQNLGSS